MLLHEFLAVVPHAYSVAGDILAFVGGKHVSYGRVGQGGHLILTPEGTEAVNGGHADAAPAAPVADPALPSRRRRVATPLLDEDV